VQDNDHIRWLHLSIFIQGKATIVRKKLFDYIFDEVKAKVDAGLTPDLVFITGDIADKGKEEEYNTF